MALTILFVGGCGDGPRMFSSGKPDYDSLSARLMGKGFEETLAKAEVKALSSSGSEDEVELQVRRIGDVRKPLDEEDLRRVEQAIYDEVGYKFNLELSALDVGGEPNTQGRVTAIDGTRLLIVDEERRIGVDKSPDAAWYNFNTADASLKLADGTDIALSDIRIGYRVQAWGEGLMLTSYPGMTSGLALDVLDRDPGEPEMTGAVKEFHLSDSPGEENYLMVGVDKVILTEFTQYLVSGNHASEERIHVGDKVEIRTTRLSEFIGGQITASQINVV
ncbi:hypothetical protein [Cohnella thailandensis]|uniref:Uncharacterized protein n=1 Tax=Cohnella thailandensis TaxID=557557 RepID=A0A841SXR9_9BACL|nr:hypothetical protein [Cohnella thailandensis]MBB6637033.1 hypothetical protein [Cohnella thailandensis]MBP1973083.1 hypothetical protein [Cohnella thailandensis]